jgi:alpha-D-ribose 1-methylphosphonate 5-triphosphate diphosphatase
MNSFVINNVKLVTPYEVLENGFIYVKKGIIDVIELTSQQKLHRSCNVIDGQGKWLFPGIVDMLSTALEKGAGPGEELPFPPETAFEALDNKLVSNGITTVYHALTSSTGNAGLLSPGSNSPAEAGFSQLKRYASIRHNIHILHDISNEVSFPLLESLINRKELQFISIMMRDGAYGGDPDRRRQKNELLRISDFIDLLAEKARKYEIRIAAFREETYSRISHMKRLGIKILEFPQGPEAAADAARLGMSVLVGAPDIVRGVLNHEEGGALDAVLNGSANMLCSEGAPASMINAVFLLHHVFNMNMAEVFKKVSVHPARALGIDRRVGSIECGKLADLVLVRELNGKPFVEKVFINGFKVFEKITRLDKINRHMRIAQW